MLNLLKYQNNTRKVFYEDYSLLLVNHVNELKQEDLSYIDGFILDTNDIAQALKILKQLRVISEIEIGLLPIFYNEALDIAPEIRCHTDGAIRIDVVANHIQKVTAIRRKIDSLVIPEFDDVQKEIQFRILAFIFTRNKPIVPKNSRSSIIGYVFPYASLFFKQTECMNLLNVLERLTDYKLLSVDLVDSIHLCKSCHGNYINYRECCPKCDSIDIEAHDMVHHFVCAHVAPEKDFKIDDGLNCPKCDKVLRHIGIDYDKPSTIYNCKTCSHEFQNSGMSALCFDCQSSNRIEELIKKTVGSYQITQAGENYIMSNQGFTQQAKAKKIGAIGSPVFKILLNQEIQRAKVSSVQSYFAKLSFKSAQFALFNTDVKVALTKEISSIIQSYLKEADVLCAQTFNCYHILLPETSENQLDRIDTIQYNLAKLINDNTTEEPINIDVELKPILSSSLVHQFI